MAVAAVAAASAGRLRPGRRKAPQSVMCWCMRYSPQGVRVRRTAVALRAPGRKHLDMVLHKAAENSDWNRSKRQLRE